MLSSMSTFINRSSSFIIAHTKIYVTHELVQVQWAGCAQQVIIIFIMSASYCDSMNANDDFVDGVSSTFELATTLGKSVTLALRAHRIQFLPDLIQSTARHSRQPLIWNWDLCQWLHSVQRDRSDERFDLWRIRMAFTLSERVRYQNDFSFSLGPFFWNLNRTCDVWNDRMFNSFKLVLDRLGNVHCSMLTPCVHRPVHCPVAFGVLADTRHGIQFYRIRWCSICLRSTLETKELYICFYYCDAKGQTLILTFNSAKW